MNQQTERTRSQRWAHYTDVPLLILAVGFLIAYAVPILYPFAPAAVVQVCNAYTWIVWVLFAVDYLVRLTIAEDRKKFFRSNVIDLLAVVLPMFRAMRLLRLLSIVTLLARRSAQRKVQAVTTYVVGFAILLVIVSSLAVLEAERFHPDSNIQDFGDSIWWSLVTMTTVGYGDMVPVTATGQVIGVLVMLTGIAVLGVVTANVAAWFMSSVRGEEDDKDQRIVELEATVETLIRQLQAKGSYSDGETGSPNDQSSQGAQAQSESAR